MTSTIDPVELTVDLVSIPSVHPNLDGAFGGAPCRGGRGRLLAAPYVELVRREAEPTLERSQVEE